MVLYREMNRSIHAPYAPQVVTSGGGGGGGGKRTTVGGLSIEHGANGGEYGQVEIERIINHRHNVMMQQQQQQQQQQTAARTAAVVIPEHFEKQRAEAAVHQHFAESFKLVQQQRVSE